MSLPVELPGLYLDAIADVDTVGISVENTIPEADSVDAAVDTNIQLDVVSTDSAIVDVDETQVWVNDVLAFDSGTFQTGFDGPSSTHYLLAVPPGQLLADGDMEYVGSNELTDGDMEAGPGADVMTDGDMEAVDTAAWTAMSATLSKETDSPHGGLQCLRITYSGSSYPGARQFPMTVGRTYRVVGWARGDATWAPLLFHGSVLIWTGTSSTSWQQFDVTFRASATDIRLRGDNTGAGHVDFDDVVLRETAPAWNPTNDPLVTKETSSPQQGTQWLKVAHDGTASPYVSQTVMTASKIYRVVGYARGDGTFVPSVSDGSTVLWTGTSSPSWQSFDVAFVAANTDLRLRSSASAAGYVGFDAVSLTEDAPDWVASNNALVTKETTDPYEGSQCLRVAGTGTSNPAASQSVLTSGVRYRVTGRARSDGSTVPRILASGVIWTGTTSASWQEIDVEFTATASGFTVNQSASTGYSEWDAMVVTELHDLRIVIDPTSDFDSEELVTVRVVSETEGGSYTVDYSYSFTIEDIVEPQLLAARATGPFTVQLTFSEYMLAESASGEHDALNPTLYEFEYVPESDRIAAVYVLPVSVAQVSGDVYEVTLDMEPTFWKTYRVTCGEIADDSSNANLLDYNARTADFASWYPPYWPERRRFDLWSMMSDDDRASDREIGDLQRLKSIEQDIVDMLLWDIDAEQWYRDIDKAPAWAIDAMLEEMGNPFQFDLTLERKRKLLSVLPEIYQEKGTDEGIVDVARFFLGITITSVTEINIDTWVLGESELGVDTDLGPSGQAELYTFWLNVDRVLTDEERRILSAIVDYMKPPHTHYQIIEPTDPEFVDHVELGLSELGFNWDLHE